MATSVNSVEVPLSTVQLSSAGTSSYTIPADRYAIVRASVHQQGEFKINGTTVLYSLYNAHTTLYAVNNPQVISAPGGIKTLAVPFYHAASSAPTGLLLTTPSASQYPSITPISGVGGSMTNHGDMFANSTAVAATSAQGQYKVIEGTTVALAGSGLGYAHIELYRKPGAAT